MPEVLCYGDSNTWGQGDHSIHEGRIPTEKQWTVLLEGMLGEEYSVTQAGFSGRVAGDFAAVEERFRGRPDAFEQVYQAAAPVDILVVALGTNDLKEEYGRSAEQVLADLWWYKDRAEQLNPAGSIIFVTPPPFNAGEELTEVSIQTRSQLAELIKTSGLVYVEVEGIEISGDGAHFTHEDHVRVATTLYEKIKEIGL